MFLLKQKTAYEMRNSDWSSEVCSSDLEWARPGGQVAALLTDVCALAALEHDRHAGGVANARYRHGERLVAAARVPEPARVQLKSRGQGVAASVRAHLGAEQGPVGHADVGVGTAHGAVARKRGDEGKRGAGRLDVGG